MGNNDPGRHGCGCRFLNNRITLTADVYLKRTKDLLLNVTVPSTSGFSSAIKNLGKVENKGIELSISSRNIDGGVQVEYRPEFCAEPE